MMNPLQITPILPPEINEETFRAAAISPLELENPEMEIVFLKNNLEILTQRFNILCAVLKERFQIDTPEF